MTDDRATRSAIVAAISNQLLAAGIQVSCGWSASESKPFLESLSIEVVEIDIETVIANERQLDPEGDASSEFRKGIEAARKDTERLDWLAGEAPIALIEFPEQIDRISDCIGVGDIRESIDAARAARGAA